MNNEDKEPNGRGDISDTTRAVITLAVLLALVVTYFMESRILFGAALAVSGLVVIFYGPRRDPEEQDGDDSDDDGVLPESSYWRSARFNRTDPPSKDDEHSEHRLA